MAICRPKRARFGGIFRKKCLLSLTPLILVDYCTHIDKTTILYLKWLTVFKFMYICTWRLLNFLNRANTDEMLFGYSLLAKVPVCKYSELIGLTNIVHLRCQAKIIDRDDSDQTFDVIVNLSIEFIWKTSIQV